MEVTSKVEAKLFCKGPQPNVVWIHTDNMEMAVSLAQGYERRLTAIIKPARNLTPPQSLTLP
jgi:hypothetical protein